MNIEYLLELPTKEEYQVLTKAEQDELGYDFVTISNNADGTMDIHPVLSHLRDKVVYIRLKGGYISSSLQNKIADFTLLELVKQNDGHYIESSEVVSHKSL